MAGVIGFFILAGLWAATILTVQAFQVLHYREEVFMHDVVVLLGMVVADLVILAAWWFLGSRLVPAEQAPASANAEADKGVPMLHKILTYVCLFLLAGLIVECVAMFPAILVRFGWS
jgi:hypothetical protein